MAKNAALKNLIDIESMILHEKFLEKFKDCLTQYHSSMANLVTSLVERHEYVNTEGMVVLPPDVKVFKQHYINSVEQEFVVITEHRPQVRSLNFLLYDHFSDDDVGCDDEDILDRRMFRFAFPYMAFVFYINTNNKDFLLRQMHVAYLDGPIKAGSDPIYHVNLTNVHFGCLGLVCLGCDVIGDSIADVIQKATDAFWQRNFTQDAREGFNKYREKKDSNYKNLIAWEEASAENPLFPLSENKIRMNEKDGEPADDGNEDLSVDFFLRDQMLHSARNIIYADEMRSFLANMSNQIIQRYGYNGDSMKDCELFVEKFAKKVSQITI